MTNDFSQRVTRNTLIQIAAKAVTVIFSLVTTILLTRYLGRSGYGAYMYVFTLIVLFGGLADWGTSTIGVREAARNLDEQKKIFGQIFLLRLVFSLLASGVMILAAFIMPIKTELGPDTMRKAIILGSLILFLFANRASFGVVFQTRLEIEKLAVADVVAGGLTMILSWIAISLNAGLLVLVFVVLSATLISVTIAYFLAKDFIAFSFHWDRQFLGRFFLESLPMGAVLLLFTVDNKIDTVMLGAMKGSDAVGVYSLAYKIYDVLILGAAYLMNALLPVISRFSIEEKNKSELTIIYQKAFDLLFIMGLAVVGFVYLFAPLIVELLSQTRYFEFFGAVVALRILSLALFLAYFNHLTGYTIVALGYQRPYFFIALGALVFNVIANFFVIPSWSYNGAAGVTVLTEALVLLVTNIFVFRLMKTIPSPFRWPKTLVEFAKNRGKIF